jgi:hypothetical protein
VPPPGLEPYGSRSRAELADLLSSTQATQNGLPEAVVARRALGPAVPLSGAAGSPTVEDRLLAGELPVRSEDVLFLASRLCIASDPRVGDLEARLRSAPDAAGLPSAPSFRRRLIRPDRIEGWTIVDGRWLLRYELPVAALLDHAGVSIRATVSPAAGPADATVPEMSRTVPVPDVEDLSLRVVPRLPDALRLAALRGVLWLSAVAGVAGLVALRRALTRESRAVDRERAFLAVPRAAHAATAIRVLGETPKEAERAEYKRCPGRRALEAQPRLT